MTWQAVVAAIDATLDPSVNAAPFVSVTPSFAGFSPADIAEALAKAPKLADFTAAVTKNETRRPAGDVAATGNAIRARLVYVGRTFDGVESAEHTAWQTEAEAAVALADRIADRVAPCWSRTGPATLKEALRFALQRLDRALPLIDWPPLWRRANALVGVLRDYPTEPQQYAEGTPDAVVLARLAEGAAADVVPRVTLRALLIETEREARQWILDAKWSPHGAARKQP